MHEGDNVKENHLWLRNGKVDKDMLTANPRAPATLGASPLRRRTAAGILGKLSDGQGECCFTNPRGGGRENNGIQAIFIQPPSSLSFSDC